MQNSEEFSHKCFKPVPSHLKDIATVRYEVICNRHAPRARNCVFWRLFFSPTKSCPLQLPCELIGMQVAAKKREIHYALTIPIAFLSHYMPLLANS